MHDKGTRRYEINQDILMGMRSAHTQIFPLSQKTVEAGY